jgi:hypothetical protein
MFGWRVKAINCPSRSLKTCKIPQGIGRLAGHLVN